MLPQVQIVFLEYNCWKCREKNHIFYIAPLHSSCNSEVRITETIWSSQKEVFRPEILTAIENYSKTEQGKHLQLATVKERFSNTVQGYYTSFGCHKCDSIFGDYFIQSTILENLYENIDTLDTATFDIDLNLRLDIPHWCHSGNLSFCE